MVAMPYPVLMRSRLHDRLLVAVRALSDTALSTEDALATVRNIADATLAEIDTVGHARGRD